MDLRCARGDRPRVNRVWIGDRENEAGRRAAGRLRAEVAVLGRLVTEPELGAFDGESRDDAAARVLEVIDLDRAESGFVKLDGARAAADGEPGGKRGLDCCELTGHNCSY